MPANFDWIAGAYSLLEHLSFGPYLQRCRTLRLHTEMQNRRRALVYGDGDGRFLQRLVEANRSIRITAVDGSAAMIRHARRHLPSEANVTLVHADALEYLPQRTAQYDLVTSHFFLDCFDESGLDRLLHRVDRAVSPDAIWVISDFAIPARPVLLNLGARALVRALYFGFRVLTGLRVRRLPNHGSVFRNHGWRLLDRTEMLGGILISEVWDRPAE